MFAKIQQIALYLTAVKYLLGLIEPIKQAVRTLESPGDGAAKRQAAVDIARAAAQTAEKAFHCDLPEELIVQFVGLAVDAWVALENARGYFTSRKASEIREAS
jgi:hypothetical protein